MLNFLQESFEEKNYHQEIRSLIMLSAFCNTAGSKTQKQNQQKSTAMVFMVGYVYNVEFALTLKAVPPS